MGACHTQGHGAILVQFAAPRLKSIDEPVEAVRSQVEFRQTAHDTQLALQIVHSLEGPPIQLDRFVGAILLGKRAGERQQGRFVRRIDANGTAQSVQSLFRSAQLETEVREELIVFGVARRSGDQVSSRLDGGVDPSEPHFQCGDSSQVLRSVAAIDQGEFPVRLNGVPDLSRCFVDARRGRPSRDRFVIQLKGLRDRRRCIVRLAASLEIEGQSAPALRRALVARL